MTSIGTGPPAVVVDDEGVGAWLNGVLTCEISWRAVERIEIQVVAVPELGYGEGFWAITGGGARFVAPIDIVVGAERLLARLRAFRPFDQRQYEQALVAEKACIPGEFICWERPRA